MDLVKDKSVTKADGTKSTVEEALKGKKIVCFYFSASWCPPCRMFTPILKEFYEVEFNAFQSYHCPKISHVVYLI